MALIIDKKKVDLLMIDADFGTYGELAKASGLHPNTLTKVLRGENWTNETAEKLATALNCNPLDVQTAEGFMSPKSRTPVVRSTFGLTYLFETMAQ